MKKYYFYSWALLISFSLWGCDASVSDGESKTDDASAADLTSGKWHATLTLSKGNVLPFHFSLNKSENRSLQMHIINGKEELEINDIRFSQDSVYMRMHIFNTELQAKVGKSSLQGRWVKKDYEQVYEIPFEAVAGNKPRFAQVSDNPPVANISGKWEVDFLNEEGGIDKAIGVFEQSGNQLLGTFLTPTGDYRYLEGNVYGDSLLLSCFDGEHAFLFTAEIVQEGQALGNGMFWSGKHWEQSWKAVKNENATLPDPHSLTYLKEGYDNLAFTFPDLQGNEVSLSDEKFQGKVVVVQLMGTWCPNCMDETKFLAPFYDKYREQGFEVIGLAYERSPIFEKASKRVNILKEKIGVNYELLIAGVNDKEKAAESLPMLNQVMSFPTTIIIDREGKVREIHTGFSGPGTGSYYGKFVEDFTLMIEKLLKEAPAST